MFLSKVYIFLVLLILVDIAIFFIKISFEVAYLRRDSDDNISIKISVFRGLVSYKKEISVVEIRRYFGKTYITIEDKDIPLVTVIKKLPEFIEKSKEMFYQYKPFINMILKKINCQEFYWETRFGLGDAALTGIGTGVIWGIKGLAFNFLMRKIRSMEKKPRVLVVPQFESLCFGLDFRCIFDLRIGHIIIAGLNFVKLRSYTWRRKIYERPSN
jgi:hypothetical protein